MVAPDERGARPTCPLCGVALVALDKLPRSHEADPDGDVVDEPHWEPLAFTYLGRGRGPLAVLSLLGLVAFFSPWVDVTLPDIVTYTGFDLAHRLGWAWAAGVAWFVLLPLVLTRRSIMQMRGARVAAAFLAAIPGTTAVLLLAHPPHGMHGVPLRFTFGWGLHGTWLFSAAALAAGIFFGGRLDDIPVKRGTSSGQVVH
jgi:hypothetical protein